MPSFQLRTRRSALFCVVLSAAASTSVLGGTAGLFSESARTPMFASGSAHALKAGQCPGPLSQARHECLREILAQDANKREAVWVAAVGH